MTFGTKISKCKALTFVIVYLLQYLILFLVGKLILSVIR